MTRIGLYLVDDHDIVRQGLRALLDSDPDVCVIGESSDAAALVDAVRDSKAEVVVMDVSLPGKSGAEATAEIRKNLPSVKVLALTRHTEKSYMNDMLEAGASGYMLKQNGIGMLLIAIRTVAKGGVFIDPTLEAPATVPAAAPRDGRPHRRHTT